MQHATADFGALARRIVGRTTDLIVIGIVLVGGLSMGRQVVEWWHAEPPAVTGAGPADGNTTLWGDGNSPVQLEFGDYPLNLQRESVSGDRDAATNRLVEVCVQAARSAGDSDGVPGDSVKPLFAKAATPVPVAEEPDKWAVYSLEDPFPIALGMRPGIGRGERKRLVCWGIMAPTGENTWTLCTFLPAAIRSHQSGSPVDVVLPENCRRLLALHGNGGGLTGFRGPGVPGEWMAFFDRVLTAQRWRSRDGWSVGNTTWSARYEPVDRGRTGQVDIVFSRDESGELSGVVQTSR